jgi:P-type E1-E2 ATPase
MIRITIPGKGELTLTSAVFDVNGTLAVDGKLLPGVQKLINELNDHLDIYLLTADTHGKQREIDQQLDLTATRIEGDQENVQKAKFIQKLGSRHATAIGQGANDALMLKEAALGICILSPEGTALETMLQADIVVPDIDAAIGLLLNPIRMKASLRK